LSIPFTIQYVPAHRGFKGNNEVDRLAKREANRLLEESSKNVSSKSARAFAEKIIDALTV